MSATTSNADSAATIFIQQPFPETLLDLDDYHGVTIRFDRSVSDHQLTRWSTKDPSGNESLFRTDLEQALTQWRLEGKRGIWVHLPEQLSFIVPHCIELGFSFHSVQQNPSLLVLAQWLPTDTPSRLPRGATHQIGVGVVVLSARSNVDVVESDNNDLSSSSSTTETKILLVQERTGPAARRKLWKMPTGLIDPGEDIADAAIRELKEETGLDGVFEGIICLRHAPFGGAGRSVPDLFFVVRVRLLERENSNGESGENGGQVVKLQTEEIADMCWMPIMEYYHQDVWKTSPAYQQLNKAIFDSVMTMPSSQSGSSNSSFLLKPHRLLTGYMPGYNIVYDNTK